MYFNQISLNFVILTHKVEVTYQVKVQATVWQFEVFHAIQKVWLSFLVQLEL